jgi:hypothetical protein
MGESRRLHGRDLVDKQESLDSERTFQAGDIAGAKAWKGERARCTGRREYLSVAGGWAGKRLLAHGRGPMYQAKTLILTQRPFFFPQGK